MIEIILTKALVIKICCGVSFVAFQPGLEIVILNSETVLLKTEA
jgi:hypothetical protein